MFVKSVDASEYTKNGEKVFEFLNNFIEEIGEKNVIQVVTDNRSNYVTKDKILQTEATNLRRMFTSDEWLQSKGTKEAKGKKTTNVVLMPSFWSDVVYTLKAMRPIVRVLMLVDNEKAMKKKYKNIFAIINRRWDCQLHHPLYAVRYYLKLEFLFIYRNSRIDDEVVDDLFKCINRLSKVYVNGKVINKAGTPVPDKAVVEIVADVPKYVCRAGHKLEAAIEQLGVDVTGKVALDSGLSTGGFTDCLLQYGASHVYGVDVGYGQVADKIRRDERVSVIERTNLRYLAGLPQNVDLVTLDLSFISILLVMPAVVNAMKENAALVTLVKPQFEARRSQVGKGGIVKDPIVHQEVLEKIIKGVESFGFCCKGWIESPLKGAEGNTEFLVHFNRTHDKVPEDLE
uniref:Uncharacterized protein yqxC n=1 Tax=Cajanus cajan TaxID=3821 RepID=A0A151SII7_CAJCA|nr:Uncharacterized protein yqxC [Cajanus cajan]